MNAKPNGMPMAYTLPKDFKAGVYLLLTPIDWNAEAKPCNRWRDKKKKEIT